MLLQTSPNCAKYEFIERGGWEYILWRLELYTSATTVHRCAWTVQQSMHIGGVDLDLFFHTRGVLICKKKHNLRTEASSHRSLDQLGWPVGMVNW